MTEDSLAGGPSAHPRDRGNEEALPDPCATSAPEWARRHAMDERTQERDSVVGPILLVVGIVGLLVMGFFIGWVVKAPSGSSQAVAAPSHYTPQTRSFTMTIVPYWVHEVTGTYDYLAPEFGKKGLLANKEVWGFSPSS